jgi:hypothetical protein
MTKEKITICNVGVHGEFPMLHLPRTVGDTMFPSKETVKYPEYIHFKT